MRPITMRIVLAWPARRTEGRGAGRRSPTRSARQSLARFGEEVRRCVTGGGGGWALTRTLMVR